MLLSKEEKKQYSRHLILDEIGEKGQLKLKAASVLVIGAGGLGCPVLQYLTAVGVGTIGIIDDDIVEQTNLQRQILYSMQDIGMFKVKAAVIKLEKLNPFITFKTYPEKLNRENALDLFAQYDIIVDGSDNFPTRYLVNDAAVISRKPLVFGSIYKFEGQVSVFNYNNGPTYRCLYPIPPEPNAVPNCSEIGVLGVLPGIIGSLQANEVIKIVCELGSVLDGKLLSFNALNLDQNIIEFSKNEQLKITHLLENYPYFCGMPIEINEITYADFKSNSDAYYLIDVREEWERTESNIGGTHISLYELNTRYTEIKADKKIVFYCQSGTRAKTAAQLVSDKISTEILVLKGGMAEV